MKRSKFSDREIMDTLKRVGAGLSVPDICRELAISPLLSISGAPIVVSLSANQVWSIAPWDSLRSLYPRSISQWQMYLI